MPASIGVNLRVTGHCSQGGRKYMEDLFSVAYQQTEDERDLEYAFFGIYDGHGGSEAAAFAKEHLMDSIVKQRQFWSDNDEDVLKAIRNGYMLTHLNMWKELEKWPKTVTGLPSTAGTTASVAFIRRGKIYIGHVGDSAIVLGYQKDDGEEWAAKPLTLDHKPESTAEMERIQRCGGKVVSKAGVPRVVWNRPRAGHKGPIKKNTPMDEIPFLAVARSLGDLWSYNTQNDEFIVSPDPDVGVLTIDPTTFRCLIFGTDGLWNMLSPEGAVSQVQATERHNEAALVAQGAAQPRDWLNPSKSLVDHALERWSNTRMRADNTSVVTLMLDPPGPPRAAVLRARAPRPAPAPPRVPHSGLTIMTRYSDDKPPPEAAERAPLPPCASLDTRFALEPAREPALDDNITNYGNPAESYFMARLLNRSGVVNTLRDVLHELQPAKSEPEPPASPAAAPAPPSPATELPPLGADTDPPAADHTRESLGEEGAAAEDGGIQINEVSSSSPTECPRARARKKTDVAKKEGGAASGRVLRSHDASPPARPAAAPPAARRAPPALERVVILSRARGVATTPVAEAPRTRARAASQPAGNARRRCGAAPDCSKENVASRRRRAPPAPPRPPRARTEPEVHSTTGECAPAAAAAPARALRSRNEAAPPCTGKRARPADPPAPHKLPRLAPPRVPAPRAAAWAPALALRNRLRKRLAK